MSKNTKILIVDNDSSSIKELDDILKNDYLNSCVLSGEQALQLLNIDSEFSLILLNLDLPDISGYELYKKLKKIREIKEIPVIFISSKTAETDEEKGIRLGAVDYIYKPFNQLTLLARIKKHIQLAKQQRILEETVRQRTAELENTQKKLRQAINNLQTFEVTSGVFWLQIPEAGLNILCGCPGDIMKHLIRKGFVKTIRKGGFNYESGPNAILLSDQLIQNGNFVNLAEFPVLHMLYQQGMMIPDHPNNTGDKPLLIGSPDQVKAQMEYIYRGNYGLTHEEASDCDIDKTTLENIFKVKLKFAYGKIQPSSHFLDTLEIDSNNGKQIPVRNGVTVSRIGFNHFRFHYLNESTDINLNLPPKATYEYAYTLGQHHVDQYYFAVIHSGEGNGWDENRPSMASIIMFQGKVFLIDAGPGIAQTLMALGIDISEVEGIFHTHAHDDHFAGLPALLRSDRRLKYFATALVRKSVMKKFSALMSIKEELFSHFFEIHDLTFDQWNNCNGLEVKPLYSPHPVENNILLFRALDNLNFKSYGHWADISSFSVLDSMEGKGPDDVPLSFINKIKADYLSYADLKKLDIGGSPIHGDATDFCNDHSKNLMLAHINRKLTIQEMEIGSESSFGAIDILIKDTKDYLRQRAFYCLRNFFPMVTNEQLQILLNSPIVKLNSGKIIFRQDEAPESVGMILSGTVAYLDSSTNINNNLVLGSLIGIESLFRNNSENYTYRTVSYSQVMLFPIPLIQSFLKQNNLLEDIQFLTIQVSFLRRTWLFGEQTSSATLAKIARSMRVLSFTDGDTITLGSLATLLLVKEGTVQIKNKNNVYLEAIGVGSFFGEIPYLANTENVQKYTAKGDVQLYQLDLNILLEIPIVHWKLLEVCEKRQQLWST